MTALPSWAGEVFLDRVDDALALDHLCPFVLAGLLQDIFGVNLGWSRRALDSLTTGRFRLLASPNRSSRAGHVHSLDSVVLLRMVGRTPTVLTRLPANVGPGRGGFPCGLAGRRFSLRPEDLTGSVVLFMLAWTR